MNSTSRSCGSASGSPMSDGRSPSSSSATRATPLGAASPPTGKASAQAATMAAMRDGGGGAGAGRGRARAWFGGAGVPRHEPRGEDALQRKSGGGRVAENDAGESSELLCRSSLCSMGDGLGADSLIPGSEKLVSIEEQADSCGKEVRKIIHK